jgi:hypothetical protein
VLRWRRQRIRALPLGLSTCTHRYHPPCTLKSSSVASPSLFNRYAKQILANRSVFAVHYIAHWQKVRYKLLYTRLLGWATVVVRVRPRCAAKKATLPSPPAYISFIYGANHIQSLLYGCTVLRSAHQYNLTPYCAETAEAVIFSFTTYSDATNSARTSVDPNRRAVRFSLAACFTFVI